MARSRSALPGRTWLVNSSFEARFVGQGDQDVTSSPGGEAATALVEEQSRVTAGASPVGPLLEPDGKVLPQLGMDGDLTVVVAFTGSDDQGAVTG